jgi:hypothetical protein
VGLTFSLDAAIASIETQLNTLTGFTWYEDGIPTYENLHLSGGILKPYIVVSYGDISEGFDKSMAGARGNAHDLPVRFYAVAPTAKIARQVRGKLTDKFTGFMPAHCAELRKRGGGGLFTMVDNNGAIVAYVATVSFRTSLTLFGAA